MYGLEVGDYRKRGGRMLVVVSRNCFTLNCTPGTWSSTGKLLIDVEYECISLYSTLKWSGEQSAVGTRESCESIFKPFVSGLVSYENCRLFSLFFSMKFARPLFSLSKHKE